MQSESISVFDDQSHELDELRKYPVLVLRWLIADASKEFGVQLSFFC